MTGVSTTLRIVLVCLPRLAADLVRAAIDGGADAEIVGDVEDFSGLPELVRASRANVLVLGCDTGELPPELQEMTLAMMPPDAAVIPLDGREVMLYVLRPRAVSLGDVSGAELVEALRASLSDRTVA